MIYLFCNASYGAPFSGAAVRWSKDRSEPVTIVMSGRSATDRSAPLSRLRRASRWVRRRVHGLVFRLRHGIPLVIVDDVNAVSFVRRLRRPAHGVVAGFNQRFRPDTIAAFESLVNFHPSILPRYRGPVPSRWCLRLGESTTGFTLHRVDAGIDTGDVLHQATVEIPPDATEQCLDQRIANAATPLLLEYLDGLAAGDVWEPRSVLRASSIYLNAVDYAGFDEHRLDADV